jgi:peptidyl-tRNA hydrolase, PTH2 family
VIIIKLAIIVRKDLNMGAGKIAGQVGHASVTAYRNAPKDVGDKWFGEGQKKIVLKIASEKDLRQIIGKSIIEDVSVWPIRDFGLTQVEPNTLTCIAIGPDTDERVDKIIKDLKLL